MEKIFTEQNGKIEIYTFKEGLLSAVAHDLLISLGKFEIKITGQQIQGKCWLESLKVQGAIVQGQLNVNLLKPKDLIEIQNNIFQKILETKKYPIAYLSNLSNTVSTSQNEAILSSQNEGLFLELKAQKHPISYKIKAENAYQESYSGEVEIKPSIWGIQPYQALFGAIKLQDRIRIKWQFSE